MKRRKIARDPIYIGILSFIKNKGSVHPYEIASLLNVTRQAIDHRLKVLDKEGLVSKEFKEGRVYYRLTERGEAFLSALHKGSLLPLRCLRNILVKKANFATLFCLIIGLIGFMYFAINELNLLRGSLTLLIWLVLGFIIWRSLTRGGRGTHPLGS
ncbi:MAG: hypothetical protein QXH96_01835 [Candidatus Geothermarchaeota archaeon]